MVLSKTCALGDLPCWCFSPLLAFPTTPKFSPKFEHSCIIFHHALSRCGLRWPLAEDMFFNLLEQGRVQLPLCQTERALSYLAISSATQPSLR